MSYLTREESGNKPRRWLASVLQSPTFKVTLGPPSNPTTFNIHEAILLQSSSTYFSTLLSSTSFLENTTREVHLSDPEIDNIEAFEVVIEYMHSFDRSYTTVYMNSWWGIMHTRVFLLAGRLMMEGLERQALWKLSAGMAKSYRSLDSRWPCQDIVTIVSLVYSHTPGPEDSETPSRPSSAQQRTGAAGLAANEDDTTTTVVLEKRMVPSAFYSTTPTLAERLRRMVTQYCASNVDLYRGQRCFKELIGRHPEFASEMLVYFGRGMNVEEMKDL